VAKGVPRGSLGSLSVAVGANTEGLTEVVGELRKVATAIRSLSTRVSNQSKKMEAAFGKAAKASKNLSTQTNKATNSAKRQESALLKESKALAAAENKTLNLVAAMRRAGASSSEIRRLGEATRQFRRQIKAARGNTVAFSAAQARLAKTSNDARRRLTTFNSAVRKQELTKAATETKLFRNKMQDLTKSVTLALGPLSGVASRLTAFAGLANKNTVAIAGMIGAVIGLGFVIKKAITAGSVFEVQFRRIEAQLEITGRSAEFSAAEINKFAEEVADATLTNAKTARQASSALLFFGQVSKENFKTVLNLAQSLSTVLGGDLVQSAKRIGRALEDPGEGLSSLNRQLALLTPREEEVAKGLAAMGEEARATRFILEKLGKKLGDLGVKEAAGVAGAFDTLVERIGRFLEIAGEAGGILQPITESFGRMSKQLEKVNKGLKGMPLGLRVVGQIIKAVTKTFEVFIFNLDIITSTIGILLVIKLIVKLVAAMKVLIVTVTLATAGMKALAIVSAIANPWLILAAAVGAVAIKMKFFNDEVDRTSASGLEAEIKRVKRELKGLEDSFLKIKTGLVLGGKFIDTSPLANKIQKIRMELKELEDVAAKLAIERGFSVEKFNAFSPGEEDALSPKVQNALRDMNNELLLLGPNVTATQEKMIKLAIAFGGAAAKVEVFVKDGVTSFRILKGTYAKLGEDILSISEELAVGLKKTANATFLQKKQTDLLSSALGRIEKETGFGRLNAELESVRAAQKLQRGSSLEAAEAIEALNVALTNLANDAASRQIAADVKIFTQKFKEANQAIEESADVWGGTNAALRAYREELARLEQLRDEGFIGQETFTNRLRKMQMQLAQNTEAAQQFASTVSSGMAAGIVAGESLNDVLARIGDRLMEAALQALIFKGIMQTIGMIAGSGSISQGGPSSDISSAPGDFPTVDLGPAGPSTLSTGLSRPPSSSSLSRGSSNNTIINIDARASDPGVEQRVLRAMSIANRQQSARIANTRFEGSRRR